MESQQLAEAIGAAARSVRIAQKLTQEEVAEAAAISSHFYARIERGQTMPSTPTLVRISKALATSADALLGLGPVPPTAPPAEIDVDGESAELKKLVRRLRKADPDVIRLAAQLLHVVDRRRKGAAGAERRKPRPPRNRKE